MSKFIVWRLPVMTGLLLFAVSLQADQVIAENAIIQGNACIGFDCVNDEAFSGSGIELKENNTRFTLRDMGADESADKWQVVANDTTNGGNSQLKIISEGGFGIMVTHDALASVDPLQGSVSLGKIDPATNGGMTTQPADGTVTLGTAEALQRLVNVAEALEESDLINKAQLSILPYEEQQDRLAAITASLDKLEVAVTQVEKALANQQDEDDSAEDEDSSGSEKRVPPFKLSGGGAFAAPLLLMLLLLRRRSNK